MVCRVPNFVIVGRGHAGTGVGCELGKGTLFPCDQYVGSRA